MPHEFEVQVDSAMMRGAWHAWFFRGQRLWTLPVAAALLLVSAYLDSRSGGLGTKSIIRLTALGLAVHFFVTGYLTGLRRALSKLDMITDGRAAYRLFDPEHEVSRLYDMTNGCAEIAPNTIESLPLNEDIVLIERASVRAMTATPYENDD